MAAMANSRCSLMAQRSSMVGPWQRSGYSLQVERLLTRFGRACPVDSYLVWQHVVYRGGKVAPVQRSEAARCLAVDAESAAAQRPSCFASGW